MRASGTSLEEDEFLVAIRGIMEQFDEALSVQRKLCQRKRKSKFKKPCKQKR